MINMAEVEVGYRRVPEESTVTDEFRLKDNCLVDGVGLVTKIIICSD